MRTNRIIISLCGIFTGLFLLMMSGPDASAQISLKGEELSAVQVIEYIQQTTDYVFFYNLEDVLHVPARSYDVTGSVESILEKIFAGTDVLWRIQGKEIILKRSAQNAAPSKTATRTVNGIVVDASDKSPLIGATVHLKGTDNVAISDLDGNFSMEGVTNKAILEVSYVGYEMREFRVGDLGFLEIALSSANELEGVIVVGAGTQKKVSVTGAIVAIKGDELKAPSSSLTSTLAGKLPGIISTTTSGEPGSTSDFYIRGIGTFGGRSTPLILLDDIEISASDLNNLPSESIESFSILKDASATAIYGARGANGVMLITTKSGMENTKTMIHVSVENSVLQPVNRVEYVDGPTWMTIYNDAQYSRNPGSSPRYSSDVIEMTQQGVSPYVYPNIDWYSLMFKDFNMNQRANINIQGGGSKVTYYMGLQANHDTGQLNVPKTYSFDSNIKRWTYVFQNNISYKPTSTTKIDLKMNAQFGSQSGPGVSTSNLFYAVYNANPVSFPATFPAEEGDTHLRFGNAVLSGEKLRTNPYAEMLKSYSEKHYTTINASLKLDQNLDFITKGLSISALVNIKAYSESSYTNT
ncbi:MAG: SusC/RagA family TonB-linked outer membrane protein, partial [Candidatus Cryptobacteroides sp.]